MSGLSKRVEQLERLVIPAEPCEPGLDDVVLRAAVLLNERLGPAPRRLHVETRPWSSADGRHTWHIYEDAGRAEVLVRIYCHWYFRHFSTWDDQAMEELAERLAAVEPGFLDVLEQALAEAQPGEPWPPVANPAASYRHLERGDHQVEGDVVLACERS